VFPLPNGIRLIKLREVIAQSYKVENALQNWHTVRLRDIPYISRNWIHWPTFLSLHIWVYLHSNLCSGLQRTHESAFWPFKVV